MKLWAIYRFELAYQLRRAFPWVLLAAMFVIGFLLARDGSLSVALHDEFFINSSFAVAKSTVVGSLAWLLFGAAVAGDAGARDIASGMAPLAFTTPVTRWQYLGGRFLAALSINVLAQLTVQLGIIVSVYAPGVDPGMVGPFRAATYLTAFCYIALPNLIVATAVQFAVSVRSGRPMSAYIGSVSLLFLSFILGIFLFQQGRLDLARLFDPIGVQFILSDLSHLWTAYEKRWRMLALEGRLLENRLAWLGVAAAVCAWTYATFRFAHRSGGGWVARWRRRRAASEPAGTDEAAMRAVATTPIVVPRARRQFGVIGQCRQTLAIASASFRAVATSRPGLAMLIGIPLLTVLVVLDQMSLDGVPLIPTTVQVLEELTAPVSAEMSRWVIVPMLLIYFAGELLWRERDAGLSDVTDAMPGSEWVGVLGKFLGLAAVLVAFTTMQLGAAVLAQRILDYSQFEWGLYVIALFGLQLPEYLLFAMLALALHVVVNQKYLGHLVAVAAYVMITLAPVFGLEHNLLIYGAGPFWDYTELRGFGVSLAPWFWFKAYWAAWAVLLAVVARLLWRRSRDDTWRARLALARARRTPATMRVATAAAVAVLGTGGYVFYNTNVLHAYENAEQLTRDAVEYERRYAGFAATPQPVIAATSLRIEIHPETRSAEIRGSYRLVNRTGVAVDTLHVAMARRVETQGLMLRGVDVPASVDAALGHAIIPLSAPLAPGDSAELTFTVRAAARGFRESGADQAILPNGTAFQSAWLPLIGYQRLREVSSASARRQFGLPTRPLIPSLYDEREWVARGRGAMFDATIGTPEDLVAVAPGALRRSWTENGRRYVHFATSAPIGEEYIITAARYAVRRSRAGGVEVRMYHNPARDAHLERMERSVHASIATYTELFGPYPYDHLTVVERPPRGTGMHADPSVISHGEGFPLWQPHERPGSLDLPFAVVAHEMGHEWGVPYAYVEGIPIMSESLAWYYAMQVIRRERGEAQVRRLLTFMRQPHVYPPIRRGEPLLRGLDPYLSYRKGPFALHALSEYAGADRVNLALRRLRERHRQADAPLATTLDLYRELRTAIPDSLHPLLHDLFEVNTFWEFEAERARAEPLGDGRWRVTLEARARKVVADSSGTEREVPLDEWIDVGVFAQAPSGAAERLAPLVLERRRIRSGRQTLVFDVAGKPDLAGIDPRHVLDWVEEEDDSNLVPVTLPPTR